MDSKVHGKPLQKTRTHLCEQMYFSLLILLSFDYTIQQDHVTFLCFPDDSLSSSRDLLVLHSRLNASKFLAT